MTSGSARTEHQSTADVQDTVDRLRRQLLEREHRLEGGSPSPGSQPAAGEPASADEKQAKAVCLRLLADSARPRANLERALTRRGFEPDVIARVLDRFTEAGLIDDQAYAAAYARSSHQHRGLSRTAVVAELRRKGVDGELAAGVAADIASDAEEARAAELVAKRLPSLTGLEPAAVRRRLLGLLARRGYPGDLSIRVVDAALSDQAAAAGSPPGGRLDPVSGDT